MEIAHLGLTEISSMLKSRLLSATELTRTMLSRIDALDPFLHAYIQVTSASALTEADRADQEIARGINRGPLHGVPIAVKDIFDMKGVPTTAGMRIHADAVATEDATVIRRLREAGAVILGKLAMTEGAYAEHRPPFPTPRNPWHAGHWPGASSSGSAVAVSAGLCYASLASETGGSIRLPAAANGVTGIKPTWGRVSRHRTFELASTLDHVGVIARSAADAAAVLQTVAGTDPADPTTSTRPVPQFPVEPCRHIEGVRLGVDTTWLGARLDNATSAAISDAIATLSDLGATIVEIALPSVEEMIWDWFPVCAVQTAVAHEVTYPSRSNEYGPSLAALIEQGRALSGTQYQRLLLRRRGFRRRLLALFDRVDVVALPVLPAGVPTIERMSKIDDELIADIHRFTCPFNMASVPSVVLPCGISANNMPLVFQLIGAPFTEAALVNASIAYQSATSWHANHPVDVAY
ncbi:MULTISPECIES: amidase [Burkholderia]|uniref:Amidase n=1 Tax=Burkholderia mayonis TaxID=1385591 RepID=A0A1B4FJN0_9BURK|nr:MULTISPECIES: amidase [Burkholderia]AOJ03822.1 amidase [Burkholderia mayonis]KVE42547.1 amidase [Burkholderia mayonis]KVE43483.1 amidase [Burkholderia sp. BDU5]